MKVVFWRTSRESSQEHSVVLQCHMKQTTQVMWQSQQNTPMHPYLHMYAHTHIRTRVHAHTMHTRLSPLPPTLCVSVHSPPVNPDKEIDDPDDSKPEDWDEREK